MITINIPYNYTMYFPTETYVDRPIWWHIMGVGVPDEANLTYPDAGFLIIGGGDNDFDDE